MYYELYIDVLFLINFMMDSLLLMAVKKVLRCPVKNGRVFVGSGLGAVLTCVLVALPLPAVVRLLAYYAGIPSMMIRVGLDIRKGRQFWKAFGLLYVSAFLMGGMLQILRPWVRTGSIFFASAVPIYYLMYGIWRFLTMLKKFRGRLTLCACLTVGSALMMTAFYFSVKDIGLTESESVWALFDRVPLSGLWIALSGGAAAVALTVGIILNVKRGKPKLF